MQIQQGQQAVSMRKLWNEALQSLKPWKRRSRISDSDRHLRLDQLAKVLPFHVVIQGGTASSVSPGLLKCLDQSETNTEAIEALLSITAPDDLAEMNWLRPSQLQDRPLELTTQSGLYFSGEVQRLHPKGWLLILQPIATSIRDLHRYGITLQDLSLSDPLRHHVLPALLNEGLQEILLQEVSQNTARDRDAVTEEDWIELELEK